MNLFINGGGGELDSKYLDDLFVSTIVESELANVIYIPVASEDNNYQNCIDWFIGVFGKKIPKIIPWLTLDGKSFDELETKTAVYVGGGNTFKLLSSIYQSGNYYSLKNFVNNGGIYYGGSAGAIILGNSIKTAPEARLIDDRETHGLNVLCEHSVACHYHKKNVAESNFYSDLSIRTDSPIIALTEKGGISVKGNYFVATPNKQTWIYRQGKRPELINEGQLQQF